MPGTDQAVRTGRVLVVDNDVDLCRLVGDALTGAGYEVLLAASVTEAVTLLAGGVPDLVLSTVDTEELGGLGVPCLPLRPDGNLPPLDELVDRVTASLMKPSRYGGGTLLTEARFRAELARAAGHSRGCVAALDLAERPSVAVQLGARADQDLRVQMSVLGAGAVEESDQIALDAGGRLLVLLPHADPARARQRLLRISERVGRGSFLAAGEPINVTTVVGFTGYGGDARDIDVILDRALTATAVAAERLDLQPVEWVAEYDTRGEAPQRVPAYGWRTFLQIAVTTVLGFACPFVAYVLADAVGVDLAGPVYLLVVCGLVFTAALIWAEGVLALDPPVPPPPPDGPYPPASAVIAAYLPNEAATVVETVEAVLRVDYPGPFQVVLAYNTPKPMPVEAVLAEIARRDPRFVPYRVEASTSKAQNVNAALGIVTGELVGVFDADHHPDPDAFRRAWRWLAHGYDVVQGHCVVRNGDTSWVARTVAVEFEAIYGVSHPGRARLHRFGIFGGSNGYWRTSLLRRVRMQGVMLTEDIDSSLRVIQGGGRIACDPGLISRELAPTTVRALWNQRTRWAQGWFQVSLRHLRRGLGSRALTGRQKLGFAVLLGWREVYPWLSVQVYPLIAFFGWKAGSLNRLDWLIPLFVLTTAFTFSTGPGQTWAAHRVAVPELRRRTGWFVGYLLVSTFGYAEFKNVISRVAQIKELMGDRRWVVTTRAHPLPEQ